MRNLSITGGPAPVLVVSLLVFILELISILKLNAGHFTYTLDDPYIHLALAERISEGHYGINRSEPAAPSSSILWPFLLVPLIGAPFGEFVPLAIGLAAALGTVAVYHRFVSGLLQPVGARKHLLLVPLVAILIASATNTWGLPFTGLEHSLQLLVSALTIVGLAREVETGHVQRWLPPLIVAGPLVRYENLALSGAAVIFLALRGHRKLALASAVGTALPVLTFSAFLVHLGIGPLPSSMALKAPLLSDGFLHALRTTLRDPSGVLLALAAVGMISIGMLSHRARSEQVLSRCMAFAIGCHAFAGSYGAYHRWEIYIVAATILALLFLERRSLQAAASRRPVPLVAAVAVLFSIVIGARYIFGLATIPTAANNIHEQQFQMHRYILEYERGPVAVNDLGYPSYRNPYFVLDLLGLGSSGFTKKTGEPLQVDALQVAIRTHAIEAALLYREWFPNLPSTWRLVGELHLSRPRITPAWETVTMYATSENAYPRVLERVTSFRDTLPRGVRLSLEHEAPYLLGR